MGKVEQVDLLQSYYFMRLTREMEDRTRKLFLQGKIVGGVYTARGHEAITVGAASMLLDGDCIVPQHRDLGMLLVRGGSPRAVMCQWLARGNSPTLGRDGQLHLGDMHHGVVPMISMLGESLPVACGVALTMKRFKRPTVVLATCGDGATNTGQFHEALNFAAVQKLPIIFVIENNGYAYSTPVHKQFALKDLADRARAYAMPGESVEGNDILAVKDAVGRAIAHARGGQGPAMVECKTFRVRGHSEADNAEYVPDELRQEWVQKDPIRQFETLLMQENILTESRKNEIEARIKDVVGDAVRFAEQSPAPDPATVHEYIFAPDGPIAVIGSPDARDPRYINALDRRTGNPFITISESPLTLPEEVGQR